MHEDMNPETITLEDEDGLITEYTIQDQLQISGQNYIILSEEDDEDSVIIFRVAEDAAGSEAYLPVEDDDELQDVFSYYQACWDDYEFCDAE